MSTSCNLLKAEASPGLKVHFARILKKEGGEIRWLSLIASVRAGGKWIPRESARKRTENLGGLAGRSGTESTASITKEKRKAGEADPGWAGPKKDRPLLLLTLYISTFLNYVIA